ncbi:hypothetical protein CMI42_03215 [Candidatus Pacearchaeota archaeon]|nr:hypothetical protein [Candidatus Pacearchaeota archaeon]|tara:strand:- start:595 stop:1233 length:639 start_codon:yes stop_codon:yes gene_type:complete
MENKWIIVISLLTLLVAGVGTIIGGWGLYHDYQMDKDTNDQYQNLSKDINDIKKDISLLIPDKPQIMFSIHSEEDMSYEFLSGFYQLDACSSSLLWRLKLDKQEDRYDFLRIYIRNEGKKTYDLNLNIDCHNQDRESVEDFLDGFFMMACPENGVSISELKQDEFVISIPEIDRTTEYMVSFIYESIPEERICKIKYESKDIGGEETVTPFY